MGAISHNLPALGAQRDLAYHALALNRSLERLSSGYRINRASDGPADLVISEGLRAQNAGLDRALRNTQDASSLLGIAEGGLAEINDLLIEMRVLALAAANGGVTDPVELAANQAEIDSGIQSIDRIARTTAFGSQTLLDGTKGLRYQTQTEIYSTQQNQILHPGLSRVGQIFRREDFVIDLTFNGTASANTTTRVGDADTSRQARKAYFEIDGAAAGIDLDAAGQLTADQDFTLSGEGGSRGFLFSAGATLGQIATAIQNAADSTGVDASLIFHSNQANQTATGIGVRSTQVVGGTGPAIRVASTMAIFNNRLADGVTPMAVSVAAPLSGITLGQNTDGLGRIFLRITGSTQYELYKDESLSAESLVGHGATGTAAIADNNSALGGLVIGTAFAAGSTGRTAVLGVDMIASGFAFQGAITSAGLTNYLTTSSVAVNGVQLGRNTDAAGVIHIRLEMTGASTGQAFAYRDSGLAAEDLVAQSAPNTSFGANATVLLSEARTSGGTAGTGLGLALSTGAVAFNATAGDRIDLAVGFSNLGVRIASREYGADAFVRVESTTGTLWQHYPKADDSAASRVTPGTLAERSGQDATLTVNGRIVRSDGLDLSLSGLGLQADIRLDEGRTGSTTLAQVGYLEGSVYTRAGSLTETSTAGWGTAGAGLASVGGLLNNAGHVTSVRLDRFAGGMQFQLGGTGAADERTVYGLAAVTPENIGRLKVSRVFEAGTSVSEERIVSLEDVLGGGAADLLTDPVLALEVIDAALADVVGLRARTGAAQSSSLTPTANALSAAIEGITAAESRIRDTDVAAESTEYTKNLLLVDVAATMLAQANTTPMSVWKLIGGGSD